MASKLGPRIVTDNLVFALDCADTKSYAGDARINYAAAIGYGDLGNWATEGTAEKISAGYNFQGQPVYMCNTQVNASYLATYRIITGLRAAASGGSVTVSIWVKNPNPTSYSCYAYIGHDFSSQRVLDADSDWQRIQWTVSASSMNDDYIEFRPYTNTAGVYIHMTMPQVEVGTYAAQYTSGVRSTLQNIQNLVGSPYGGTWIASNTSTITFNSSSPTSGGSYQALHGDWNLSNGQIPRYSKLVLKYTISSNNAQDSSGNPLLGGNLMGTTFGPGDLIDNNTEYNTVPLTVGTHYIHINADGEAFSDGRERINLFLRTNGSAISTGSIVMTENHLYYSDNGMIFPVNSADTGINQYQVGDVVYPAGSNGARYLDFDGTNQYVTISSLLNQETINGSTTKTIILWLNADSYGSLMPFSTGQNGANRIYYWTQNSLNTWRIGDYVSTTDHSTLPSAGTWFCTAIVINALSVTGYLNGVQDYTGTYTAFTTQDFAVLGRHGNLTGTTTPYYYNGKIGQVLVYNEALTAAEVLDNYNSTKSRFS